MLPVKRGTGLQAYRGEARDDLSLVMGVEVRRAFDGVDKKRAAGDAGMVGEILGGLQCSLTPVTCPFHVML